MQQYPRCIYSCVSSIVNAKTTSLVWATYRQAQQLPLVDVISLCVESRSHHSTHSKSIKILVQRHCVLCQSYFALHYTIPDTTKLTIDLSPNNLSLGYLHFVVLDYLYFVLPSILSHYLVQSFSSLSDTTTLSALIELLASTKRCVSVIYCIPSAASIRHLSRLCMDTDALKTTLQLECNRASTEPLFS